MPASKRSTGSAFRDAVNTDMHAKRRGENGMIEYTDIGVGSNVMALGQLVRGGDPASLVDELLAAGNARDVADFAVLTFATRNARGGKGERDLSYRMFLRLWSEYPETGKELLRLFAHFGYWKDYLNLMVLASEDPMVSGLDEASLEIMAAQLQKDSAALIEFKAQRDKPDSDVKKNKGQSPSPKLSLLAKWLPREGYSFDKKISFAKRFAALSWPHLDAAATKTNGESATAEKQWRSSLMSKYRKTVAELTSYLELPEVLLSAHREDEINFGKVASKATLILTKTFLNEDKNGDPRSSDPKRLKMEKMFVEHMMSKGLKGGQVMPHEIVHKILTSRKISRTEELVLDAQWKDLWKGVVGQVKAKAKEEGLDFDPTRMVPLSDVSGSMSGVPMEVSIALGIGISEITHTAFRDMVMTFESTPRWHRLVSTDSIVKKVRSLQNAPWGGSTDFLAAVRLVLSVAEGHGLKREDMPSLIVFSDMQFDQAAGCTSYGYYQDYNYNRERADAAEMLQGVNDKIKTEVKKVASRLGWDDASPTPIVFWNLRSTGGHPVDDSTEGTVLLSGFSPSLLKLVMSGEALKEEEVEIVQLDGSTKTEKIRVTPAQILRKMLDDTLYDPVREVLAASREGALLEYGSLEMEPPGSPQADNEQDSDNDSTFELV